MLDRLIVPVSRWPSITTVTARRLAPWLALAWLVLVQAFFYRKMLGRFGDELVNRIEGLVTVLNF